MCRHESTGVPIDCDEISSFETLEDQILIAKWPTYVPCDDYRWSKTSSERLEEFFQIAESWSQGRFINDAGEQMEGVDEDDQILMDINAELAASISAELRRRAH